jgi:hypothetical protein
MEKVLTLVAHALPMQLRSVAATCALLPTVGTFPTFYPN